MNRSKFCKTELVHVNPRAESKIIWHTKTEKAEVAQNILTKQADHVDNHVEDKHI